MEPISDEERKLIRKYKKYESYIDADTINEYWADNFDGKNYDELVVYLSKLKRYLHVVDKASTFRQQHYERFIQGKRFEDLGHRKRREMLNVIAADAKEKYNYWKSVERSEFDKFVALTGISDSEDETLSEESDEEIVTPEIKDRKQKKIKPKIKREEEITLFKSLDEIMSKSIFDVIGCGVRPELPTVKKIINDFVCDGACSIDSRYYFEDSIELEGSTKEKILLIRILFRSINKSDVGNINDILLYHLICLDESIYILVTYMLFEDKSFCEKVVKASLRKDKLFINPFLLTAVNSDKLDFLDADYYDLLLPFLAPHYIIIYTERNYIMMTFVKDILEKAECFSYDNEVVQYYLEYLIQKIDEVNKDEFFTFHELKRDVYFKKISLRYVEDKSFKSVEKLYEITHSYFNLPVAEYEKIIDKHFTDPGKRRMEIFRLMSKFLT